jgi:hypothetical protein
VEADIGDAVEVIGKIFDIRSHECQVLDVTADGAKLVADIEAPIGSTFQLPIVPQSIVQRRCEVV